LLDNSFGRQLQRRHQDRGKREMNMPENQGDDRDHETDAQDAEELK
jgi:hypothetical protein